MISINNGVDEPGVRLVIEEDAIRAAVTECDVPLVAIPSCLSCPWKPPFSRRLPRAHGLPYRSAGKSAAIARHACRPSSRVYHHACRDRLTTAAERCEGGGRKGWKGGRGRKDGRGRRPGIRGQRLEVRGQGQPAAPKLACIARERRRVFRRKWFHRKHTRAIGIDH
jgi:hypothetical protein